MSSGAIAIGNGASATADGNLNFAAALGDQADASAAGGNNNLAIAIGNPGTGPVGVPNSTVAPNGTVVASLRLARATRAVAGELRVFAVTPDQTAQTLASSNNNVAIAIGDGAASFAGQGSNNIAGVVGQNSTANAFGGDFNRASVVGNNSFASAIGGGQTATVVGNNKTVGGGAFGA